ncbi:MAG TPA: hypothetical protein VJ900_00895 [Patescibacteria group bacterium]|nr:hypothetical protein [Patescibacteria group bacterium]
MRFNLESFYPEDKKNQIEKKEKAINSASEKLSKLIELDDFRLSPNVKKRFEKIMDDTFDKYGRVEIESDRVLTNALEKIYRNNGSLINEELKNVYIDKIADEIANMVAAGQEVHKAIGQKMVELKRADIRIDSKKVEKAVREKI